MIYFFHRVANQAALHHFFNDFRQPISDGLDRRLTSGGFFILIAILLLFFASSAMACIGGGLFFRPALPHSNLAKTLLSD